MHRFSHPLELADDPATGAPTFGLLANGHFISDPLTSECGRFQVDPQETYGICPDDVLRLQAMNGLLDRATQTALEAACLAIQQELDIDTGDLAGLHFTGSADIKPISTALANYMLAEYRQAHPQAQEESAASQRERSASQRP